MKKIHPLAFGFLAIFIALLANLKMQEQNADVNGTIMWPLGIICGIIFFGSVVVTVMRKKTANTKNNKKYLWIIILVLLVAIIISIAAASYGQKSTGWVF